MKVNADIDQLLRDELRSLRKGSGMTARKLRRLVFVRQAIARQIGVAPEALTTGMMAEQIVAMIDETDEKRIADALRNAYGLSSETESAASNLSLRRQFLASLWGRHSDTLEVYENKCIESIVFRLTADTQTDELARTATLPLPGQATSGTEASNDMVARSMLAAGLDGMFQFGEYSHDVIKMLGKGPVAYRGVSVSIDLNTSPKGKGWYRLRIRYAFQARLHRHRIAVVSSAQDGEVLMAAGIIDDYFKINSGEHEAAEIAYVAKHIRIIEHDPDQRIQEMRTYRRLGYQERQNLLQTVWQLENDDCTIFEARLQPLPAGGLRNYVTSTELELSFEEPYFFWSAPNMMHLDALTVDVSRFPNRDKWFINVQPFLGTFLPGVIEPNSDKFSLNERGWIMPGHGVAVIWRPLSLSADAAA